MGRIKKTHHLEPLKRMNYPQAFVFLDTESRVAKPPAKEVFDVTDHKLRRAHTLRMAVGERWEWNDAQHEYVDQGHGEFLESEYPQPRKLAEAFWQWVEDFATVDRPHIYVMAHNVGYDLLASAAYPVFAARGWKSEAVYHKGPVFIQRLEKNHRRITFLSSSNYYVTSLAKLAKGFGMEKGDGDWNGPEGPLLVYCRQDVAILRVAMLWLVGQLRELQTPFADTISSVAFKAFRTRFQTHDIEVHVDPRATLLERRSYCGGRAEPFFIGRLPPLAEGEVRSKWDFSCLTNDTRLSDGRHIGDLQVGDIIDGQRVTAIRRTPDAPIVELKLSSGHSVRCTPTHRFPVIGHARGREPMAASWMRAGHSRLQVDDWPALSHPEDAVMAGIIFAEGPMFYLGRPVVYRDAARGGRLHQTRHYRLQITIDERETELRAFIDDYLRRHVSFYYTKLKVNQSHGMSFIVSRKADVLAMKNMVDRIERSTNLRDLRGWLCGVAEGDGSVNAQRHQVVITQNADVARHRIQAACERLGFKVREFVGYYSRRMPRGELARRSKQAMLSICPSDSDRWMSEVSFLSHRKRSRMPARLVSRQSAGTMDVTDISLDGNHLFWANGIRSHNSLYPSVMVDNDVPTRLRSVESDWSVDRLNRALDEEEAVIADVTVDVPTPCVPLKWSRLVFPVGQFPVVLTTPELRLLREEGGRIVEVRDVARYDKARVFKSFIEHFWSMRAKAIAEGNEAVKQLAKNLMNNLYGKFGQESEEWIRVGDCGPEEGRVETITELDDQGILREVTLRYYAGGIYRSVGAKSESYNSFPAIASFITAYGRCRLWLALKTAGFGHFYACDTDSVLCDERGSWNLEEEGLLHDTELGLLKCEDVSTDPTDEVLAAKVYRFNGKQVWKGHKSDSTLVKDFDGKDKWLTWQWPTLAGMLQRGTGLGEFYNEIRLKDDHPTNVKSVVQPDGWCRPFTYGELPKLSPSQRRDLRMPPEEGVKEKVEAAGETQAAVPVVAP